MDSFKDDQARGAGAVPSWFTIREQRLIAAILVVAHLGLFLWWTIAGGFSGELTRIDAAARVPYQLRLDLNDCDWPSLTLLPGISETTARRIILDRDENGSFASIDDLKRVRGIGPKKLGELRPYLFCKGAEAESTPQ